MPELVPSSQTPEHLQYGYSTVTEPVNLGYDKC